MLPNVWTEPFNREIINELKLEAAKRFRRFQLPQSAEEWKKKRRRLLDALKRKLNIQVDHRLELDCRWSSRSALMVIPSKRSAIRAGKIFM